jgi:Zn-dependent protease
MSARRILLILIIMLAVMMPAASVAQLSTWIKQDSYDINVDQMVGCFGIVNSEKLIEINVTPVITMRNPLIIQGSAAGMLEVNSFNAYVGGGHPLRTDLVVGDGITSYAGKPLSDYDLILIGGPGHNPITQQFVDQGVLQCDGTDIKMPGLVMEVANLSNGRKIMVIGDVSGYPYHKKDLPLNGLIPETLAPAAAIATGMSLGVLGGTPGNSGAMSSFRRRPRKLFSGYLNAPTAEAASETEMAGDGFGIGSFLREIAMLPICTVLFGLAFIVADKPALKADPIIIYMVMGGVALIMHDLGHRMVARKLEIEGHYKIWGWGTLTMLLTSWLFSMAFSQPGRYVFDDEEDIDNRDMAFVTLAGPAISMLFAIMFLPFALIDGVAGQIAVAGFIMNLMTAVYNLMPFSPMDGKVIYDWSRLFWMPTFVPLALFFILMTLFFV